MRFGAVCLLVCLMLRTFEVVVWVLGWGLFVYCGFDCLLLYTSVVFVGIVWCCEWAWMVWFVFWCVGVGDLAAF